jgi:putative flippase GtrA
MQRHENEFHRTTHELLVASRFALVGAASTILHISIVWSLIAEFDVEPLIANLTAFVFAFGFSFIGHYLWSFRSSRAWQSALIRFISVSLAAFAANNVTLAILLDLRLLNPTLAAVFSACLIPLFTFVTGRLWTFK